MIGRGVEVVGNQRPGENQRGARQGSAMVATMGCAAKQAYQQKKQKQYISGILRAQTIYKRLCTYITCGRRGAMSKKVVLYTIEKGLALWTSGRPFCPP